MTSDIFHGSLKKCKYLHLDEELGNYRDLKIFIEGNGKRAAVLELILVDKQIFTADLEYFCLPGY